MAAEWIDDVGSLWRERARALQLRIRSRFRVAVDRHRRWHEESDYSSALRRLVDRAQGVWADHASAAAPRSSSLKFYRKKVEKDVDANDDSTVIRLLRALAVPVIGNASHVFMHGLNQVQIYGAEKLHQAVLERPEGKPLITVSNHVAAVDDPFVIASLLPPSAMLDARNLRWTLCATDRCFTNPMLSTFFRCVKVLPVSRGDGIYQKGMDMALSKLNDGGWVHIFPEGSRSKDGGRTIGSAKRGVGRLVMDADAAPMVIPFVHTGMQDVMPVGTRLPKIGRQVTVLIGDPITFDDLLVDKDDEHMSRDILYDSVSSRIRLRLQELKLQVDRLALQQPVEVQDYYIHNTEHGYRIWQQVDWEGFGMENFMLPEEDSMYMRHIARNQSTQNLDEPQKATPARKVRMEFSYGGGIMSRVHGYMNPAELMGFAARGLFMNGRILEESHQRFQEAGQAGLKAWKRFLEGMCSPSGIACDFTSIS